MAVSTERSALKVDRIEEHGDVMQPAAIGILLQAHTEAQGHTPPELSLYYVPGLPIIKYMMEEAVDRVLKWLQNVSDEPVTSDYNPLE